MRTNAFRHLQFQNLGGLLTAGTIPGLTKMFRLTGTNTIR